MHRQAILGRLETYLQAHPGEKPVTDTVTGFIRNHTDCFDRELLIGHVTGSAWIVNPGFTHTLLLHHVKLDKWLQPGGHCDGDPDVLAVAMKEAWEETGLNVRPFSEEVFDVDVHTIPLRKEVPEHIHYDVRFLLLADMAEENLATNHETREVRWVPFDKVAEFTTEESVLRMLRKSKVIAARAG